jgi:plasmid stabilization system protein ParE
VRTQRVEFLEFVESDLRHVRDFYASWQFDGARKFQDKFRETISWIEWNPELFPRKYKYFRRAIIRRTYFGIFYVIEPEVTVVVAVLDLRRDPRTVRGMLSKRAERR